MIENEEWRDIEGYGGYYQVSNLGRVRSFHSNEAKILKLGTDSNGYQQVNLSRDGNQKRFLIHRLVAEAFIPNPDNKPQTNHINGIKSDNHVENLEWCTSSENIRHAYDTGLQQAKQGEDKSTAKLTNDQASWIRNNYVPRDREFGTNALARKFKVDPATISLIVHGKTYTEAGGVIAKQVKVRKLTDEQVKYIRENYILYDREFGTVALGRKFGVDPGVIGYIVNNKTYRAVK